MDNSQAYVTKQPGSAAETVPLVGVTAEQPTGAPAASLEYLRNVDKLHIQHVIRASLSFREPHQRNYVIANELGQQLFFAHEQNDLCDRIVCGADRSFTYCVLDNYNHEVMRFTQNTKCCSGGCFAVSCGDESVVVIEAPLGNPIGYIRKTRMCCQSKYILENKAEDRLFMLGPHRCKFSCCQSTVFVVSDSEEREVGEIRHDLERQLDTGAENIILSFPMNLDITLKAAMIGATFLIDFLHCDDVCCRCMNQASNGRLYTSVAIRST